MKAPRLTTFILALLLIVVSAAALGFILARLVYEKDASVPTVTAAPRRRPAFRGQLLVASWYGIRHHGRRTASGQIFNMHGLSVAHRTLPFGTPLRLTLDPRLPSVVAPVNDRGPFTRDRFGRFTRDLDVSFGVARRLGFVDHGEAVLCVVLIPRRSSHGRP